MLYTAFIFSKCHHSLINSSEPFNELLRSSHFYNPLTLIYTYREKKYLTKLTGLSSSRHRSQIRTRKPHYSDIAAGKSPQLHEEKEKNEPLASRINTPRASKPARSTRVREIGSSQGRGGVKRGGAPRDSCAPRIQSIEARGAGCCCCCCDVKRRSAFLNIFQLKSRSFVRLARPFTEASGAASPPLLLALYSRLLPRALLAFFPLLARTSRVFSRPRAHRTTSSPRSNYSRGAFPKGAAASPRRFAMPDGARPLRSGGRVSFPRSLRNNDTGKAPCIRMDVCTRSRRALRGGPAGGSRVPKCQTWGRVTHVMSARVACAARTMRRASPAARTWPWMPSRVGSSRFAPRVCRPSIV